MRELQKGMFARSLAGHDAGKLYVVIETEEKAVLLADGRLRSCARPKKKNRLHIQPDFTDSGVFAEPCSTHTAEIDAAIRKAIRSREENACQKQM